MPLSATKLYNFLFKNLLKKILESSTRCPDAHQDGLLVVRIDFEVENMYFSAKKGLSVTIFRLSAGQIRA